MKKVLSITVDENTISIIEKELSKGLFRNKSHIFEYAVNKLVGDKK